MTALQKVNLGTAPGGTDGDPVRTAFTRANSNVDVLNAQAALTSVYLAAAQALSAAHVGKRVSFGISAAATSQMPKASDAGADGIVCIRNVGSALLTLAPANGSSDTIAYTKINPGESILFDSDGTSRWNVLMRGRANSDNETVNGTLAVGGGIAGNLAIGGAVGAINGQNLLLNGSGEFGTLNWSGGPTVLSAGADADGRYLSAAANNAAVTSSWTSGAFLVNGGQPVSTQAEILIDAAATGAYYVDVQYYSSTDGTGSTVLDGNNYNRNGAADGAWRYVGGTETPPATAKSARLRLVVSNATWTTLKWRRSKVEHGASRSLYSQEVSIAYLQGAPALSGRPTFAGKTPWDNGNFTPGNYAALTGAPFSGPVSVSTTANATKLQLNGWGDSHGFGIVMQSAAGVYTGSAILINNPDGYTSGSIVLATDHVAYNTTSDYRLKTVVGDAKGALDIVCATPVHRYTRKRGDGTVYMGFLAHELQERVSYAVRGKKDARREVQVHDDSGAVIGTRIIDDYQMADYPSLVGVLWAALQEAVGRIEVLEAR